MNSLDRSFHAWIQCDAVKWFHADLNSRAGGNE